MKHIKLLLLFLSLLSVKVYGQTTYLWSNGATTPSISVNPSVTTTYRVTITHGGVQYFDSLVVNVNASNTPTFTQVGPYVSGASIPALPTTSNNGITGTWSPAINNTATMTYTFTPSAGQCATTTTMTITINQPLQYTLTANDSTVCAGTTVTLSVNLQQSNTVTDIDGNIYETVQIGNQIWMKENLRTTRYQNGDLLPNITDGNTWYNFTQGAWAYYNNDSSFNIPYGKLYNGFAAGDNRNMCPNGWHVPSDSDWNLLEEYIGVPLNEIPNTGFRGTDQAKKLKEAGNTHWVDMQGMLGQPTQTNTSTNESGFTALPGGFRGTPFGDFQSMNYSAYFWANLWQGARILQNSSYQIIKNINDTEQFGMSIRCIKD